MGTTLSDKDHKARKQHKCSMCGGDIEIGDTYRKWVFICAEINDLGVFKIHSHCDWLIKHKDIGDYLHDDEGFLSDNTFSDGVCVWGNENNITTKGRFIKDIAVDIYAYLNKARKVE